MLTRLHYRRNANEVVDLGLCLLLDALAVSYYKILVLMARTHVEA